MRIFLELSVDGINAFNSASSWPVAHDDGRLKGCALLKDLSLKKSQNKIK
jgi:hypothetical protein